MSKGPMTWALIVQADKDWLKKKVTRARRELFPDGLRHSQPWEVIGCQRGYAAVLDRTPGSERAHDLPLISYLARESSDPMYLLYLHEDGTLVEVYKNGKRQKTLDEDPYSVAERFGCELRSDSVKRGASASARGVVLLEGGGKADVERALRGGYKGGKIPFRIDEIPGGVLIYDPDGDDAPPLMFDLSEALPDKDIYTITSGPGRFSLLGMRGGEDIGSFEIPRPKNRGPFPSPELESVKGETTPAGILRALKIPKNILDVES